MALKEYVSQPIKLRVSDRIIGSSKFGQVAEFEYLIHKHSPSVMERVVVIGIRVDPYGLNGTELGDLAIGGGLSSYYQELKSDNDTLVDMTTGNMIAARQPTETPTAWIARCNTYTQDVMLQATYFYYIRDTKPVQLKTEILKYIMAAQAMGYFQHTT